MGAELALVILKRYWPFVLGATLIGGGLTYIKVLKVERDHYKAKVIEVQAQLDKVVVDNQIKTKTLEDNNNKLTQKVLHAQEQAQHWYDERNKEYDAKVAAKKELTAVKLDLATVRLYNSTTVDYTSDSQGITKAEPTNDGKAASGATLADLLKVSGENNFNHLKCIATVEAWQQFWLDYVENVKRANKP